MFKTILVAIDGSDAAHRALTMAIELASKHKARLYIAHVHLHGRPAEELERLVEIEHIVPELSLIHISEPTRLNSTSRMPSSA